jgi:hypothetical protein
MVHGEALQLIGREKAIQLKAEIGKAESRKPDFPISAF